MRPASVALSSTMSAGARPIHSNTARSPAHRHSDLSENIATQYLAFECGSVTTSSFMLLGSPASMHRKFPKSACAVPGAHSSSRYPSRGEDPACSRLHRATYLQTDEYDPEYPRSETILSYILLAVWRCLRGLPRSSSSTPSIQPR